MLKNSHSTNEKLKKAVISLKSKYNTSIINMNRVSLFLITLWSYVSLKRKIP